MPELLLVEDDRDYAELVLRAIRQAGLTLELRVARDGQEAMEALGLGHSSELRLAALPRVVFLDLMMPRMDGWEVLRRLRASPRTAHLPVVVVSSSDRPEDIARSYALGANSYLLKHASSPGSTLGLASAARYWIEMNRSTHETEPSPW